MTNIEEAETKLGAQILNEIYQTNVGRSDGISSNIHVADGSKTSEKASHLEGGEGSTHKSFICQDELDRAPQATSALYYEEIIYKNNAIPTRPQSWHDFFNGLVWSTFPQTKSYLNKIHMKEIEEFGLNPRTRVRNHLTHFDECGVVLFVANTQLANNLSLALAEQDWRKVFVDNKTHWHEEIKPVIFGHANYEMLLAPFIGLTGKVIVVDESLVRDGIIKDTAAKTQSWPTDSMSYDEMLLRYLTRNNTFQTNKPFYPLPLLGVPGWYGKAQDDAFYNDKSYFMPKR